MKKLLTLTWISLCTPILLLAEGEYVPHEFETVDSCRMGHLSHIEPDFKITKVKVKPGSGSCKESTIEIYMKIDKTFLTCCDTEYKRRSYAGCDLGTWNDVDRSKFYIHMVNEQTRTNHYSKIIPFTQIDPQNRMIETDDVVKYVHTVPSKIDERYNLHLFAGESHSLSTIEFGNGIRDKSYLNNSKKVVLNCKKSKLGDKNKLNSEKELGKKPLKRELTKPDFKRQLPPEITN